MRVLLCILPLAFIAYLAAAQENQPTTFQGLEGKTVSRVDFSTNPLIDVEALRPLLKQNPNTALSIAAIQESVAALERTKMFSKVQVKIEPYETGSGLRVLFILEPAYYVGLLSFPGTGKAYPYSRLLQVVNIPNPSPFVDSLPDQAKTALQQFFQSDGFFAADVQPETQRDSARRIVNIIFHCTLHRRAKIGQLNFPGLSPEQAADLRGCLGSLWARVKGSSLRPGQPYSSRRAKKSLERIREHLQSSGHLIPVVRQGLPSFEPQTNRANPTFEVQPGPLVTVKVVGAHLSKRTMKKLIPIYEDNSVDPELVHEGERNLVSHFQSKRYFDVKVDSQISQGNNAVSVVYTIHRGAKHTVEGVFFEGNHYFADGQLESQISIRKEHFFFYHGKYSETLLRKSVASLTALYRNEGFAGVKIDPQVRDHEPEVDVTFRISEGQQDKVNSLRIVNARNEPLNWQWPSRLNLGPGKPYSPRLLELDRNQIVAEYLNRGYLNTRFDSQISPSPENPHLINVVYSIDQGQQARVGQVAILGAETTRPSFIRLITKPGVREGQPISEGQFLTSESELYNVGIFDWASISPLRPIEEQSQEEVLIRVHESRRNTLDVGAGLEVIPRSGNVPVGAVALPGLPPVSLGNKFTTSQKSFFGPRFLFQYGRHNLRGRAEGAAVGLVLSRLDQRISFRYTDPYLLNSSWSSLFSVFAERSTENPIFTARLGQVSFQVERALDANRTKTARARYSFQRTNLSDIVIPDLVLPEDRRTVLSTFYAEYLRDSRDQPLDAHHGIYQTLSFGISPSTLGSSSDFLRFLGQNAFYLPVRPWLTWANNLRVGFAVPFVGGRVPLSERFFSGGADSLRGFPINGAGPQRAVPVCSNPANPATCSLISVPVGGHMLAIFNSEGRFPIPVKKGLGGVLFYDGGNVYSNISFAQLTGNYTNSVGIGLRYQTPVGPVRFDVGHNLNAPPGVKATQYFITLGQAF